MWAKLYPRIYDAVMGWVERAFLAPWRRSTVHPARGLVIEIGAGTGLDFAYYQSGATVIATDPDRAMLARAKERLPRARADIMLVAADAEALPFCARVFDAGVVGLALCTIPHPDDALGELRRVLKWGTPVRLLEHVRVRNRLVAALQDWLTPLWMRVAQGCRLDRDAVGLVARAGFALESVRSHAGGYVVEIVARAPTRQAAARGCPTPAGITPDTSSAPAVPR
jgi:ubiquinone/menaquinone biosynthesis C-methylase UbiE